MKTWLRRTLIGMFGVSVLTAGLAWAHQRHAFHHHRWGALSEEQQARLKARAVDKIGRRLDLDTTQKAQLAQVAERLAEQYRALRGDTRPHDELQALVSGQSFDRARAQAFVAARTGALAQGSPAVIAALGDFYDGLRPEQQQKVRDLLARGSHRRHHGWRG